MGSNVSKLSYMSQATNDLEKEIRIFECSELLNNDNSLKERSFNSIYTHICFDSEFFQGENPKNLEIFLNENFNKLIAEFILNTPFFRSQDGLYDMRRIRLLLFTLTFNTNVKTNTKENPDKGAFIFSLIRDESCEQMNEPIKSEEKDLHDVILDLFNISCIEIPKFYIEKRHNNPALKVIEDFEKNKQAILKNILDEIMKDESGKTAFAISPQIFLERFTNYRLFLTSGHIRTLAYDITDPGHQRKPKDCCVIF